MILFFFVWFLLVAAAGGLALGLLRGRELRKSGCAGLTSPACLGCSQHPSGQDASVRGR